MLTFNLFLKRPLSTIFYSLVATLLLVISASNIQAQDFVRIKNRWQKDGRTDYRINTQNAVVDAGATDPNWWSAQWVFEKVAGTEFYRIKNRWQKDGRTDYYLHVETGKLEAGAASPGWLSAMWSLEKVDDKFYRIKNRWKPDQYLNIEGPVLAAGPIQPNMWSAMWELEGFKPVQNPSPSPNPGPGNNTLGPRITGVGMGAVPTPAADLAPVNKLERVKGAVGAVGNSGNMPAVFSLDMPPIGSQGREGSCAAWACAYALKSFEMKRATGINYTIPGTSNLNIMAVASPEYLFNRINLDNNNCGMGSYFVASGNNRGALDVLKTEGVVAWAFEPYSDQNGCGSVENAKEPVSPMAVLNRIKNYAQVKDLSTASLKALLLDQHPIVFGISVSDEFMSAGRDWVWRSGTGGPTDGHAMVIVGYDDAKRAYKVQNSWGTGWGDNGYTWLDYEFAKTAIWAAYVTYSDNLNYFDTTTPGFVSVYNEAGYVAKAKLTYTLSNGQPVTIERNFSLGFSFKEVIPPGAVNVSLQVDGIAVIDPLKLKFSSPTANVKTCYKIWGTIFDTEFGAIDCAY